MPNLYIKNPAGPLGAGQAPAMRRTGTRRIEGIAAEHLQRLKKQFTQAPLAVDLNRAERDGR